MNIANKVEILTYIHSTLQDHVRAGDNKAAALITFKLVMLAFLRTQVEDIRNAYSAGDYLVIILSSAFMVSFMISTIYILRVLIPRIISGIGENSTIFFYQIANMKEKEYVKLIAEQSDEDLAEDLASQIHALSVISVKKYASIHRSVFYFGIANVCFWIAILRASLH